MPKSPIERSKTMLANIFSHRILLLIVGSFMVVQAQNPPAIEPSEPDYAEFNKRAILPVEAGLGFSSQQSKALFTLQVSPQATLIKHCLRLGATLGSAYTTIYPDQTSEQWTAYIGPKVSYKLKQFELKLNGLPGGIAFGNLNVFFEHLWSNNNLKLYGGGFTFEALKKAAVTLKIHRDYRHQSTWGQLEISYNFIPQKKESVFPNNP